MFAARPVLACLAGPAFLAASAVSAVAQNAESDARCFIVSNIFAKVAKDAKAKQAASQSKLFYLGRLNGSAAQLEKVVAAQAKSITQQNASSIMQSCAKAVLQRASELQAIGDRLGKAQAK